MQPYQTIHPFRLFSPEVQLLKGAPKPQPVTRFPMETEGDLDRRIRFKKLPEFFPDVGRLCIGLADIEQLSDAGPKGLRRPRPRLDAGLKPVPQFDPIF